MCFTLFILFILYPILGGLIYYVHFVNKTENEKIYAKANAVLIGIFLYITIGLLFTVGEFYI